ncbi:MAG: hypothetical protein QNL33_13775 [Akkermansiaceae bacterium]
MRILFDEGHAHWVKLYWGEDYLEEQNCFYHMLLIGGLSADWVARFREQGTIPPIFWIVTTLQLLLGLLFCRPSWKRWRRYHS